MSDQFPYTFGKYRVEAEIGQVVLALSFAPAILTWTVSWRSKSWILYICAIDAGLPAFAAKRR